MIPARLGFELKGDLASRRVSHGGDGRFGSGKGGCGHAAEKAEKKSVGGRGYERKWGHRKKL
jgi:hypothetical protein|tara:strand:- start:38444 stop:38629 length:186 start_codon:yes stop_codon:yes gene_type:complete